MNPGISRIYSWPQKILRYTSVWVIHPRNVWYLVSPVMSSKGWCCVVIWREIETPVIHTVSGKWLLTSVITWYTGSVPDLLHSLHSIWKHWHTLVGRNIMQAIYEISFGSITCRLYIEGNPIMLCNKLSKKINPSKTGKLIYYWKVSNI